MVLFNKSKKDSFKSTFLLEKENEIAKKLGFEQFNYSSSRVTRLKELNEITIEEICREAKTENEDLVKDWLENK